MKQRTTTKRTGVLIVLLSVAITLLFNPPTTYAAPNRQGQIHTVQPGENLSTIARNYGVSLSALMQANGIGNANVIYVGQRLTIPSGGSGTSQTEAATSSVPTSGSSSGGYASSAICYTYTVRLGDTLAEIARKYGVTVASLQQANGLGSIIWPRLTLRIPCGGYASYPDPDDPPSSPRVGSTPALAQGCLLVGGRYQVRSGDTLSKIAARCAVSVEALKATNNLRSDSIRVGQWLIISPLTVASTPTPIRISVTAPTSTPTPTAQQWQSPAPVMPRATAREWESPPTATPTPTEVLPPPFPAPRP